MTAGRFSLGFLLALISQDVGAGGLFVVGVGVFVVVVVVGLACGGTPFNSPSKRGRERVALREGSVELGLGVVGGWFADRVVSYGNRKEVDKWWIGARVRRWRVCRGG